jgi:rubrerythrin
MRNKMPGLSTLPPGDNKATLVLQHTSDMACTNCGKVSQNEPPMKDCPACGAKSWTNAVTTS